MENQKKGGRLISPDELWKDGFKAYKKVCAQQTYDNYDQFIFEKGNIHVTLSVRWQICDEEGNVGNEYVDTMEELYNRAIQ